MKQIMTKINLTAVLALLLVMVAATATATATEPVANDELQPGMVNPGYHEPPDWFKNSFLDIREDIQDAAAQDRRVLLYFYQDGCPYCKKLLDTNFSQRDIAAKTRRYFDVITINIWGDREVTGVDGRQLTEKQFAADLGVMFTPTLLFLNEDGESVSRVNGYYPPHKFEVIVDYAGQHLDKQLSLREYWAKQSPVAESGVLHQEDSWLQPPYRLAQRSGERPLLVLFEQKDCPACDELHLDILKRKQSIELLEGFDVVLLDMWASTPLQTPTGGQSTASEWARELKVQYAPTLAIFDPSGQEVFRTDAWLRTFHVQSALEYVLSGAYREQPSFQRYVQSRADNLEAQGVHVDLMQ
jgi:thioredoxin-related protein